MLQTTPHHLISHQYNLHSIFHFIMCVWCVCEMWCAWCMHMHVPLLCLICLPEVVVVVVVGCLPAQAGVQGQVPGFITQLPGLV